MIKTRISMLFYFTLLIAGMVSFGQQKNPASDSKAKLTKTRPQILNDPSPKYTVEALENGIEGNVIVSVTASKDGKAADLKIIRGLGYGLDEMALDAAARIEFSPARDESGKPVDTPNLRLEISFRISLDLKVSPGTQRINAGDKAQFKVSVEGAEEYFKSEVEVSCTIYPETKFILHAFTRREIKSGKHSMLTLTTSDATPPGTYRIEVTGKAKGLTRKAEATLEVLQSR